MCFKKQCVKWNNEKPVPCLLNVKFTSGRHVVVSKCCYCKTEYKLRSSGWLSNITLDSIQILHSFKCIIEHRPINQAIDSIGIHKTVTKLLFRYQLDTEYRRLYIWLI